ncbi:MAG: vanadium-dependent haloperoxidase [Saprospiraceae bacterium]|nr:vanadium-dependent haloperoxidase [Saprospiraceae bacterium]
MKYSTPLLLVVLLGFSACVSEDQSWQSREVSAELLHEAHKNLTDIMVHDIFSPPVASRIYAYSSLAAWEVMARKDAQKNSMVGQLNGLSGVPDPEQPAEISFEIAALHAFNRIGRTMIFSEDKMETFQQEFVGKEQKNFPKKVWEASANYGEQVAQAILDWSGKDNYKETRSYPKFSVVESPGRWQPTPPSYMDGIEPHWSAIRPFVLDSAQQFKPAPPPPFSMEPGSAFYEEVKKVYDAVKAAKEDQVAIASFWDCNPYVANLSGHFMFATKKITPGGHWMGITTLASRKAGENFGEAAQTYAMVSLALADGFISCWDEKYRSSLIRPETVINRYLDEAWVPVLQTPPFPEHTSGHSVVSAAAATVLTARFGDNFAFDDTVEVEFGLPVRHFTSFQQAASEAAISRFYGGIHYMPAITEGEKQGKAVGNLHLQRLRFDAQLSLNLDNPSTK